MVVEDPSTTSGPAPVSDSNAAASDADAGGPSTRQNTNARRDSNDQPEKPKPKLKPARWKIWWDKVGLDVPTVALMFKGSLPPTISIAIYQANPVARTFKTLGYLVPIISILSLCILPRAKFLRILLLNMIAIAMGSAIAMLGMWSGVQARLHTAPPGSTMLYNSSQAAVCGIWLFFNIYVSNVMRAKLPTLQLPVIIYSIFTNVAYTYAPSFRTTAECESFVKLLLKVFFTAFALSAGVSLFIFPVSSRTVVFKEMTSYVMGLQNAVKSQRLYLESLERTDMFSNIVEGEGEDAGTNTRIIPPHASPESTALKGAIASLTALHGKLNGDLPFAKQEFAYGKLDSRDLTQIVTLFRGILIPLVGLSSIMDIFERISQKRGWIESEDLVAVRTREPWEQDPGVEAKSKERKIWNEIMGQLHEPFAIVSDAMDKALSHAGILLELLPNPKPEKTMNADLEAKGDQMLPGEIGFAAVLIKRVEEFYAGRSETIRVWACKRGLSTEDFESSDFQREMPDEDQHRRDQQELYIILYMEHLLHATGVAVVRLVTFAESKVSNGKMKKKRIIIPGRRRIWKWLMAIHAEGDTDNSTPDSLESRPSNVYMGSGFSTRKDPEHLPAVNAWQRFGNQVRKVPRFLKSDESSFGFRVACATMSVGIVAFLEESREFFLQQRLVWAMIIIAISMSMTAGQSIFGFVGRVVGTALSMVLCFVVWYIVNGETAGVIVMLWLFIFIEMYFFFKFPAYLAVWLVCMVTEVLIIGYELQVLKIGIKAATSSGQPFYPIYKLAPYRLATVVAGAVIGFIWTIFPYPLTDSSSVRKDLGSTMFLLANYYSMVHSTIRSRIQQTEGDLSNKHSPGSRLLKVRHATLARLMALLPSVQQHAEWQRWEPSFGGKFPRRAYEDIVTRLTSIRNYLSLMSFASESFSAPQPDPNRSAWIADLRALLDTIAPTSHGVTSTLSLVSFAVKHGAPLPPYMRMPPPYQLSRRLEELDRGVLDARHVREQGYAGYAVMQVASSLVSDDLERLVEGVRELVGEVDFRIGGVGGGGSEGEVGGKGKRE